MPFGARASVHAWDRIGSLLAFLAQTLLMLPVLRFVDDYFSIELPRAAEHGMQCFARLVRCLLGPSSIAAHKLCCGNPLPVLGLTVTILPGSMSCVPTPDKVAKWVGRIRDALSTGSLTPGMAGKLAGALGWASQSLFHRLGRAPLLPLFKKQHTHSRNHKIAPWSPLYLALHWWLEVLQLGFHQSRSLYQNRASPVHLFAGARGHPARLAAVLLIDGEMLYCDCEPPQVMMEALEKRHDNQIMGLELFALALGLSSFAELLCGRTVFLWSDNVGAERGTTTGRARPFSYLNLF